MPACQLPQGSARAATGRAGARLVGRRLGAAVPAVRKALDAGDYTLREDGGGRGRRTRARVGWVPEKAVGKEFPAVPEHIAEAADEAHRCFSIRAYRTAVLMARSVIEATAKEKGITQGKLVQKIDEMRKRDLIREYVKDGAHEIRYLGTDMAHGDFVEPVEEADAEIVLALMDEVLNEVFQAPAKVEAAKAARAAKMVASQSTSGGSSSI